jgi:hypothetical protein
LNIVKIRDESETQLTGVRGIRKPFPAARIVKTYDVGQRKITEACFPKESSGRGGQLSDVITRKPCPEATVISPSFLQP